MESNLMANSEEKQRYKLNKYKLKRGNKQLTEPHNQLKGDTQGEVENLYTHKNKRKKNIKKIT
jgi:hypothetical protein